MNGVKKWFNYIRNHENLSYDGLNKLRIIEKEFDRLNNIVENLDKSTDNINDNENSSNNL